jgi:hypothetical protein
MPCRLPVRFRSSLTAEKRYPPRSKFGLATRALGSVIQVPRVDARELAAAQIIVPP